MAGPLKNPKHERFAQELAKGATADSAYASAGFRPHRGNAARLSANENVRARVAKLQAEAAAKVTDDLAVDAAWVLRKSVELHAKAIEANALPAAKGALELIGKNVIVQAFREQMQHTGVIEYRNLSDNEIAARIAAHEVERARATVQ